jgi:hypothetical protein
MSRESKYGCLICALLAIVLVAGLVWSARQSAERSRRELAEQVATYAREDFQGVKRGQHRASIWTADQIVMLAADADCIRNATAIDFGMNEINGPGIREVNKLVNVQKATFYCLPTDDILAAMEGMPNVEELSFDSTGPSEKSIRVFGAFPKLKKLRFSFLNPESERRVRALVPTVTIEIDSAVPDQPPAPAR